MKKILPAILLCIFSITRTDALNVTIIQDINAGQTMDVHWQAICTTMGHTATIVPATFLDLYSNLATTDVLIYASGVDNVLNATRISTITQYLQNGGKVYMQTEYDSTLFDTDIAFANILRSFGSTFSWLGTIAGVLAPMNVLGSVATDYTATYPLGYFWYGCAASPCSDVENFLEFGGNYFGFVYCTPNGGRISTTSDQDWIIQNQTSVVDSLMMNIFSNLAKTNYNCAAANPTASLNLGNDTTICSGTHILFHAGGGFSTYLWQNGLTDSVIIADTSGAYAVQVSNTCLTLSDTINLIVQPCNPPNAAFATSDTTMCGNSCIDFTDLSVNFPTSWQWQFPGGAPSSSTSQNPTGICYSTAGTYDVILIVSNINGSDTITHSNYITIFPQPVTPVITQSGDTLRSTTGYTSYQWYYGSDTISGATNSFYVATLSGNYNLVVTDENGCQVGGGILNVIAGINELNAQHLMFTVFPNPGDGNFEITFHEGSASSSVLTTLSIVDVLGQVIYSKEIKTTAGENKIEVTANNLAKGIYLLRMIVDGKSVSTKIFVE